MAPESAGLQTAGAGVLGSISAPLPPIAAPSDLAAPMGDLRPLSGETTESSSAGGGWLSWITGSGTVQKTEPQVIDYLSGLDSTQLCMKTFDIMTLHRLCGRSVPHGPKSCDLMDVCSMLLSDAHAPQD